MIHLIRQLVPPILWGAAARLRRATGAGRPAGGHRWVAGEEQPVAFYDWSFEQNDHWKAHYTESRYYPLWAVVADRLRRAGAEAVLDIGCGPGQVAALLADKGVPRYLGLDFSPARVEQARAACPQYRFEVADIFETDLPTSWAYDTVLIMEFLEHVEGDLEVLTRLRPGARVIATVPNFPATGHVRHFESAKDVEARYRPAFASLDVEAHLANPEGRRFFLMDGIVASD